MPGKNISPEDKAALRNALKNAVEQCTKLGYRPSYFMQDLANLDVEELVFKYVLAKAPTEGFTRLWEMKRLDLTVEAIVWRFRHLFDPSVGDATKKRLRQYGYDVEKT